MAISFILELAIVDLSNFGCPKDIDSTWQPEDISCDVCYCGRNKLQWSSGCWEERLVTWAEKVKGENNERTKR